MNHNPQIRILLSDLLYYGESQELADFHKTKLAYDFDECLQKTDAYRRSWEEKEEIILSGMQKLFDLQFYKPIIDVTLAPMFVPKSKPLIINFYHEPDNFIDTLTHELFHNLFTDNQYVQHHIYVDLLSRWEALFGKQDRVELVHIPVHAGLKAIYLDVLQEPYRLERDIKECQQWPEYRKAWEYVEKNDYKKIVDKFKNSYKDMKVQK